MMSWPFRRLPRATMPRPPHDLPWPETQRMPSQVRPPSADLSAPATQIVADRDDYLGQGRYDIGRRIADDQVELFINGEVAPALQAEFQRHQPEFIAVHDVGTSASLRLLGGLASAAGARVQRLSVRRQGQGVALAVLQFVEVPLADGSRMRVYATDVSADGQARLQVAQVLLGYSQLGVLMVGELPPHAMTTQLAPLREAVTRGPWPNRELLLLPLGSGTALAAQAAQLAAGSPVAVHVTPRAGKPAQAWQFIAGAWNRLHGKAAGERSLPIELGQVVPRPEVPAPEAPTQPMGLDNGASPDLAGHQAVQRVAAGPAVADAAATAHATTPPGLVLRHEPLPMPVPGATRWNEYVTRVAALKGSLSCCVFDTHTLQALAHAGGLPSGDRLAQQGSKLLAAMTESARALGMATTRTEAAITSGAHHLVLRPVPGHPGVALHLVLDASIANLTLARLQLDRIEAPQ
jgi:hypothetical protein